MAKVQKTSFIGTAALALQSTSKYLVALVPTIPEGRLGRVVVKQQAADSVAIGYNVDLLDALPPLVVVGQSTGSLPAEMPLYRIIGQQTATAGNSIFVDSNELGYPYISDGNPTVRNRFIYIVISTSSGSAAGSLCNFDTVVVVESMYTS